MSRWIPKQSKKPEKLKSLGPFYQEITTQREDCSLILDLVLFL
ncbi:protein of unknown function [Paenibacillus alvei]|uniref:Uncharacterized protein n=1 Tax=Paenibacillus alvei TaxID=44250 RepID=A0A383R525_PAEAL|nr:protein of unknown function [Paenibacillus alvei]